MSAINQRDEEDDLMKLSELTISSSTPMEDFVKGKPSPMDDHPLNQHRERKKDEAYRKYLEKQKGRKGSIDKTAVALEIVRLAKDLISEIEKPVILSVFSFEDADGKFYPEGSYPMRDRKSALSHAGEYVREGYDVVVWQGDTLIAYGGRFNEMTAMRHGTGTVNRLTKRDSPVKNIL